MSTQNEYNKMLKEFEKGWKKIEVFWNKWIDIVVPPVVEEQTAQAEKILSRVLHLNIEAGNIASSRKELEKHGIEVGSAIVSTLKGSYIIGLEFGSKNKKVKRSEDYMSKQFDAAADFLVPVCLPLKLWVYKQVVIANIPSDRTDEFVEPLTKLIYQWSSECFRQGLRDSAKL